MQQWTWVAIAGLGLFLVVVLWAMLRLRRLANEAEEKMTTLQSEVSTTLRQAQETLGRVEILVQRTDLLLRDKVSPSLDVAHTTLEHVERSVMHLADGVERIQGTAKMVAAMGAPGAMAMLLRRIPGRGGRLGFLALAAGAVVRAFLARHEDEENGDGADYATLPFNENHAPHIRNDDDDRSRRAIRLEEGPLAVARVEP